MKVSPIASMILASVVVLIQQNGVVSTLLRGTPSNKEDAALPTHLAVIQKFRDLVSPLQSQEISEHKSDSLQKMVHNLPGKKKEVCPPILKDIKKAKAYSFCLIDVNVTISPALCLLYKYDGVTVPDIFMDYPAMAFEGIFSLPNLLSGILINIPSATFGDADAPYIIFSQINGVISTEDGGFSDIPISLSYSIPWGKNLCGVDKINYLHFNNTANMGEAVVTFH
jgi:hypothetical protein